MLAALNNRYEHRAVLGCGDLGTTHLVTDRSGGEWVALKVFVERVDLQGLDAARARNALARARDLNHPHLIVPRELSLVAGTAYQLSDYFPGESLDRILNQGNTSASPPPASENIEAASASVATVAIGKATAIRWSAEETKKLLQQLAAALDALHGMGLRHGNLKLSNVLVSREADDLHCIACDPFLGFLRGIPDAHLLATEAPFRAPEETPWLDISPDGRADAYSLGVIGFRLLTGHWPYPAMAPSAALELCWGTPGPAPREWNPELPAELDGIVRQLLSGDPDARWPAFVNLVRASRTAADTGSSNISPPATPRSKLSETRLLATRPPDPLRWLGERGSSNEFREALTVGRAQAAGGRGIFLVIDQGDRAGPLDASSTLRADLEASPATVLSVRIPTDGPAPPFQIPLRALESLLQRWGFLDDRVRGAMLHALHQRTGDSASLLTAVLPDLASLLPQSEPPPPVPAERERARVLSLWSKAILALGLVGRPVVLWVEGAHRMDADSLDWFRTIMAQMEAAPMLVVALGYLNAETAAGQWLRELPEQGNVLTASLPRRTLAETASWLLERFNATTSAEWHPEDQALPALEEPTQFCESVALWIHPLTAGQPSSQEQALRWLVESKALVWQEFETAAKAFPVNTSPMQTSGPGQVGAWCWKPLAVLRASRKGVENGSQVGIEDGVADNVDASAKNCDQEIPALSPHIESPDDFSLWRLDALEEPLYLTLEALALWPEGTSAEAFAAQLSDLPKAILAARLDKLRSGGWIGENAIGYYVQGSLIQRELMRRMSPNQRCAAHEALAALPEAVFRGPPLLVAQARARHQANLTGGRADSDYLGGTNNREDAATALLVFAQLASEHQAHHAAAQTYDSLARIVPAGPDATPVFFALAKSQYLTGHTEAAAQALDKVIAGAVDPETLAERHALYARVEANRCNLQAALNHIEFALQQLGEPFPNHPVSTVLSRVALSASNRYSRLLEKIGVTTVALHGRRESLLLDLWEQAADILTPDDPARVALANERILALYEGQPLAPVTVRSLIRQGILEGHPEAPALRQAEDLIQHARLPHESAAWWLARGRLFAHQLEFSRAREAIGKSRDEFRKIGDPLGEAEALMWWLPILALQSTPVDLEEAGLALATAGRLACRPALEMLGGAWMAYATALAETRPLVDAIRQINRAAAECGALGDSRAASTCWDLATELYLFAGNPLAAAATQRRDSNAQRLSPLHAEANLAHLAGTPDPRLSREARAILRDMPRGVCNTPETLWLIIHEGTLSLMAAAGDRQQLEAAAERTETMLTTAEARIPLAWFQFRMAEILKRRVTTEQTSDRSWMEWAGQALIQFDALGWELPRQTVRLLLEWDDPATEPDRAGPISQAKPLDAADPLLPLWKLLATGTMSDAPGTPKDTFPQIPEHYAELVLRILQNHLGAERAALFLPGADDNLVLTHTTTGHRGTRASSTAPWASPWLARDAFSCGEGKLLEHYLGEEIDPLSAQKHRWREPQSLLAVPLRLPEDKTCLGVVCLGSIMAHHVFGERERLLAESLGHRVGAWWVVAERLHKMATRIGEITDEQQSTRQLGAWASHAATLESESLILELLLRDAAASLGFTALALVWKNQETQSFVRGSIIGAVWGPGSTKVPDATVPSRLANTGDPNIGGNGNSVDYPETWGRLPEVLKSQAYRWTLRQVSTGTPPVDSCNGNEQQLLMEMGGEQGLWLPLVSRGEAMGGLLSAIPPGTPRPSSEQVQNLHERMTLLAPLLVHAHRLDILQAENQALEQQVRESRIDYPDKAMSTAHRESWNSAVGAATNVNEVFIAPETLVLAGHLGGLHQLAQLGPKAQQATLAGYFAQIEQGLTLHGGQLMRTWAGAWLARFDNSTDSGFWAALTLAELLESWRESAYPPTSLPTGMGLHYGKWGETQIRITDFTESIPVTPTSGIALSLAKRNARYRTHVLASQEAVDVLDMDTAFPLRPLGTARLDPDQGRVGIYELYGAYSAERQKLMESAESQWLKALRAYRTGARREATAGFAEYLRSVPGDRPARLFLKQLRHQRPSIG